MTHHSEPMKKRKAIKGFRLLSSAAAVAAQSGVWHAAGRFGMLGGHEKARSGTPSVQSLDRGVTILEAVAKSRQPVTVGQLREFLGSTGAACSASRTPEETG